MQLSIDRLGYILDIRLRWDVQSNQLDAKFLRVVALQTAIIYATILLSWSNDVPGLFAKHAKLKWLYEAVAADAKVRAVWDRNEMP